MRSLAEVVSSHKVVRFNLINQEVSNKFCKEKLHVLCTIPHSTVSKNESMVAMFYKEYAGVVSTLYWAKNESYYHVLR